MKSKDNAEFPGGVTWYMKASVTIGFPEDRIVCKYCPLMETYSRNQCRMTGEYLIYPESARGYKCPLIIDDEFNDAKG